MKTRSFGPFALVAVLSLVLGSAVSAQSPHPPSLRNPTSHPTEPAYFDPAGDAAVPSARQKAMALRLGSESTAASAVPIGQPGLSFRYVQAFGVTGQAYPADVQHLNGPNGLFIDSSNNLYVAEELGSRMLKSRTSDGANLLHIGTAGMRYTDDYVFTWLEDAALDGSGNIWVVDAHRAVQYDASGNFLQQLPPDDPWNPGSDDTHFKSPCGIAFDSAGRMVVSDRENHRIQVYDFVGGSPVHSATIGVTGVPGADDAHFDSPNHIAIDGSDRLYVADMLNHRIECCTYAAGWTCTTFHGTGSAGSGPDELNTPTGVAVDSSDNVYIADRDNNRIKKCTSAGSCTTFATGPDWMHDVAVDSSGNVYASAWLDSTIRKYDSGGVFLGVFAGTTGVPYVADTTRLNTPWGIAVTADGSIYVVESWGVRLVKLNAAGIQQWTIGQAGVWGSDNAHLSVWLQGNPAIDAAGRIYVPDTGNHRVQIFNSNGTYSNTLGNEDCSPGNGLGNKEFCSPRGVAVDSNGRIYVADSDNHRVQIFDSSYVYTATLGVTGVSGSDDAHFSYPGGVTVDAGGEIYVADTGNRRVQKCTLSGVDYACTTLAGVTGECGDDFDHLCEPYAVAVDASGRVYVADKWNNRLQVFDSTGAYLTTIGGAWGANTGQMRDPSGVALDSAGNVYVTDSDNHRIQKFAPGVPGWRQVNINGFGDPHNIAVSALEVFGDRLYAASMNQDAGARVWRSDDGRTWTAASQLGFGTADPSANPVVSDMILFNGQLYASLGSFGEGPGGQIWRSPDGTTWTNVEPGGFGDGGNTAITAFGVFGSSLYAGTLNWGNGLQIWRSGTGNAGEWAPVVSDGRGDPDNYLVSGLVEFKGLLYAGIKNEADGAEIWRTADGASWDRVSSGGWDSANNLEPTSLAVFGDYLYAGTGNYVTGGQLWRTANGADWMPMMGNGFGDHNNLGIYGLRAFRGDLYAVTVNQVTGMEVWRSADGAHWGQVSPDGFGDSNNVVSLWTVGITEFKDRLYVGTYGNSANGGEIWMKLQQTYLPLVLR